nr:hypothetical protein Iba_chr03aCG7850 [Ipomoea batatas]GMC73800.1 hypothetical protein Iba_chr03cCG4170 [Ipomoea batatas]
MSVCVSDEKSNTVLFGDTEIPVILPSFRRKICQISPTFVANLSRSISETAEFGWDFASLIAERWKLSDESVAMLE